jgi:hypothetical protein
MDDLSIIIEELEAFIANYNAEMEQLDSSPMSKPVMHVLGQSALLLADGLEALAPLEATMDLDATISATPAFVVALRKILAQRNLELDDALWRNMDSCR